MAFEGADDDDWSKLPHQIVEIGEVLVGDVLIGYKHFHERHPCFCWGHPDARYVVKELKRDSRDNLVIRGAQIGYPEHMDAVLGGDSDGNRFRAIVMLPRGGRDPEYPHDCTRCGRHAYVGLHEVTHRSEEEARDCPARRA